MPAADILRTVYEIFCFFDFISYTIKKCIFELIVFISIHFTFHKRVCNPKEIIFSNNIILQNVREQVNNAQLLFLIAFVLKSVEIFFWGIEYNEKMSPKKFNSIKLGLIIVHSFVK